ncbi:hypothetical protein B0J14DRAFT_675301, partial [Halenospora varia]
EQVIKLSWRAAFVFDGPFETYRRFGYSVIVLSSLLAETDSTKELPLITARIGQSRGIFNLLSSSTQPVGLVTLVDRTKLDAGILENLLEYIIAEGMAIKTAAFHYSASKLTKILLSELCVNGLPACHDFVLPALSALNDYLSLPSSSSITPFHLGHKVEEGFYDFQELYPEKKAAFHRLMDLQFAFPRTWLDVVDFVNEFASVTSPETILFVDIGGGNGHQCEELFNRYPDLKGRVVLED